jgi:hypothetical protein
MALRHTLHVCFAELWCLHKHMPQQAVRQCWAMGCNWPAQ